MLVERQYLPQHPLECLVRSTAQEAASGEHRRRERRFCLLLRVKLLSCSVEQVHGVEELEEPNVQDPEYLPQALQLGELPAALVLGELALADPGFPGDLGLVLATQITDEIEGLSSPA